MSRKILNILFCLTLGIVLTGCSLVKARTYVEERARVDQEPAGNAGFLFGTPSSHPSPAKKTRKVYVLEVMEKTKEENSRGQKRGASADQPTSLLLEEPAPSVSSQVKEVLQEIASPEPFIPPELPTEYTVGKDDTLQTIAKKFYNSYGKWPKIYEANKDKIPDPNRIKPGLVLTIPAL